MVWAHPAHAGPGFRRFAMEPVPVSTKGFNRISQEETNEP
jgi:hypothetical protein